MYNLMSRTELELFPYNTTTTSPLMKTLGEGEIYMNGDGLGMIVNESGTGYKWVKLREGLYHLHSLHHLGV